MALLLAGVLALVTAAPASAHARFVGSDPAEGAVLSALPDAVVMTYSEDIAPQFVDTAVVPPGGDPVVTEAAVAGVDVTVDVAGAGLDPAAGTWQVVARVVSADGHPVEHTATFEVEAAPEAAGTADPADPADPSGAAATVAPSADAATVLPSAADDTPGAEPSALAGDPTASVTDGLPRWAVLPLALAALAAGGVALAVHLRRRTPPSP